MQSARNGRATAVQTVASYAWMIRVIFISMSQDLSLIFRAESSWKKQPRSTLRGIEQQEPKTCAASGEEYDP
jgi:hypothetical protein